MITRKGGLFELKKDGRNSEYSYKRISGHKTLKHKDQTFINVKNKARSWGKYLQQIPVIKSITCQYSW